MNKMLELGSYLSGAIDDLRSAKLKPKSVKSRHIHVGNWFSSFYSASFALLEKINNKQNGKPFAALDVKQLPDICEPTRQNETAKKNKSKQTTLALVFRFCFWRRICRKSYQSKEAWQSCNTKVFVVGKVTFCRCPNTFKLQLYFVYVCISLLFCRMKIISRFMMLFNVMWRK